MKGRSPAFQFYPGDWLSSPKIALMTPAEEGAYIRLLCYAWADPDCSVPDDDTILGNLSRLGEGWLKGGSAKIRECFMAYPKKPERLFNERLMEERKKQEAWRKKSQEGGKRSAASRALKAQAKKGEADGWLKGGSTVVEPKANSSSSLSLKELKKEGVLIQGQETPLPSAKPSPKKKPIPIPLPEGFTISDDLWDWATKKHYSREWMEREFEKFCNRNRANGEKYIDWEAAFRNWMMKAEEFSASRNGRPAKPTNGHSLNRRERIPL